MRAADEFEHRGNVLGERRMLLRARADGGRRVQPGGFVRTVKTGHEDPFP